VSRELPQTVGPVATYLATEHGRHLQNVVFGSGKTCEVCAKPLNHALDALCQQCQGHLRSGLPLADRVGMLIYAEEYDSQSYKVVRQYKSHNPGPDVERVMLSLLGVGLRGHTMCVMQMAGHSGASWAVLPSSKGRTRLGEIVRGMTKRPDDEIPLGIASDYEPRRLRPENFVVASPLSSEHVLLVDDSWVSGSNAQSAAAALKAAGAKEVSVFIVARILDPTYEATKRFLSARGRPAFDAAICPWTGGDCP
jgi:predicted amidophosphoribosyltransferase